MAPAFDAPTAYIGLLMSVMSEELAEQCSASVTTVIRRGDVVPRLSCHSVEALLMELSNSSPAKRAVTEIIHSASSALQSVKDKYGLLHISLIFSRILSEG